MIGLAVKAGARIPHNAAAPPSGRFAVIFPIGVAGEYTSIELALAAAVAGATVIGAYGSLTGLPYAPGTQYVSFKTDTNPVLNCFPGGASLGDPHTYVDLYFADLAPLLANISGNDSPAGGGALCGYLQSDGATVSDGLAYLDREEDPVVTGNNVDTTAWGPFKLVPPAVGGGNNVSAEYPLFVNNCTNYPPVGAYFPQAVMAAFTIIRNLEG